MTDYINIFLDTHLWIDYAWYNYMEKVKGSKRTAVKLIEKLENSTFFVIFSQFSIIEISNHFADWFLLKKVIKSGFSYREFKVQRKNYSLTQKEKNKIDEIIENIGSKNFVDTVTIKALKSEDLDFIFTLVNNQIEFFDALHIFTASKYDVKYFVTSDTELRGRVQPLINEGIVPKLKLIKPNNFLKIVETSKN